MQKYSVYTKKGVFHTTDFRAAMEVMKMDFENQKKQIEKEKEELKKLQQEFTQYLDNYIPEDIEKAKFGGEK